MLPIIGPITPYRRVCGSVFLFIAGALAPNVHFVVKLMASPRAARWTIWGLLVLYVAIVMVPGLRRVTHRASLVTLAIALALVTLTMVYASPLKQMIASAIGFYSDPLPWQNVHASSPTWTYRNPFAGYTLQVPQTWAAAPGPIEGTTELSRSVDAQPGVVGRLRPSCDLTDEPLPMTVQQLAGESPGRRACGDWHGLQACLVERNAASSPAGQSWEWLGRVSGTRVQIRLSFELVDERVRTEALAIINSVVEAPASFKAIPCPNPSQWAEPSS